MKNFFLFLLLVVPLLGISQTIDVKFDGNITNYDLSKKEAGVTIAILQNGNTIASAVTSTNGKYSLKGKVDTNIPFDIVFSKSGMVSKRINFNLKGINVEDSPAGDLKPVEALDIELFGERPGVDFSFLNTQPIGKFTWNSGGFAQLDQTAMRLMTDKINKLLKDSDIKKQQNDLAYQQSVQAADKAYNAKDYVLALAKYEEATKFKPKEMHPINRINEIDGILQQQKVSDLKSQQDNAAYNNLITAADNFFKAGDYEKAKAKYYEASDISDEQYPLNQIKEISRLVKEKENEGKYKQLIESADLMLKQKSYKTARDNFAEASKLKPNEQYPKDKIKEIDDKLKGEADVAAKKAQYEALIAEAEAFIKAEKWLDAKAKFEEALKIESASTYVNGQLDIIKKKLADIQAEKDKAEKIAALIKEGNQAFVAKTFDDALAKFKEVLTLEGSNAVATEKIAEINGILAEQQKNKDLEDKFNAMVKAGDDFNTAKKYAEALAKYKEAIGLKPDSAVEIKIQEVQKKIDEAASAAELETNFSKLVSEGAAAITAKDYPTALAKYEAALALKSSDTGVTTKISEIKKLMNEQQAANQKLETINRLIQEGTELMEGGVMDGVQLEPAKAKFNEVLALDPQNAIAKAKITEIDKLLKAEKELADKDAKFNENVGKGDAEIAKSEWSKAIGFYNVALTLKEDAGVRQKLTNAQAKLDEAASAKQIETEYQSAIASGASLKTAKKYTEAIAQYERAKTLKPSEQLPQEEITAIQKLMDEEAAVLEKSNQIKSLLQEGETLFASKDYASSKQKFDQVIGLESTNATAIKRLADIESELAKLANDAAKNAQIAQLNQEGEALFNGTQYEQADAKFKQVIALDPNNATAKKYISDIASKLLEQRQLAEIDSKFNAFVAQGDNATTAGKFQDAVAAYSQAIALKNDAGVQQKLDAAQAKLGELSAEQELNNKYTAAINAANNLRDQSKLADALVKYTEALNLKPGESYPKNEIEKIQLAIQSEAKTGQISALLAEGTQLFSAKDYNSAKAKFESVLAIDQSNAVAINKIKEIDNAINAQAASQAAEAEFQTLKSNGMAAFNAQDYNNAMGNFERALKINDDAEIKAKIAEILSLRSEQTQKTQQITELLSKGKTEYDQKNWTEAKANYTAVLALDPSNSTATSQLALIETAIQNEQSNAQQTLEYNRLKAKGLAEFSAGNLSEAILTLEKATEIRKEADVEQKIIEIKKILGDKEQAKKLEVDFTAAMEAAAGYESNKDLENALNKYKEAATIKPSAQLPKDKIEAITQQLNEQNAVLNLEKQYTQLLQEGDALMSSQSYTEAIQKYKAANNLKPNEETPPVKIKLAEKAIEDAKKNLENVAFEKLIQDINTTIGANNYVKAKELYTSAIAMQPNDSRLSVLLDKINRLEQADQEYNEWMKKGQVEETATNYQEAITMYEKAKLAKSTPEVIAKLDAMRTILDQANAEKNKATIYQQYMDAGVNNLSLKEYELAINNFKNALNAKPNDPTALSKMSEAESLLEKHLEQNKQKAAADLAFNQMVAEADEFFNKNNFQKAAEAYRSILAIKPDHTYSKRQLAEAEKLNKQESAALANQQYQKILDVADNNFRSKNYDRALEYYRRALSIKSNDMYPKKRIEEIKALLNPVAENTGELLPLGEPFDGSILDGESLLQQAEEQRKNAKRRNIIKAEEKALLTNQQLQGNKNAELTATINSIFSLYSKIVVENEVKAVDKLAISADVNRVETRKFQVDTDNQNYQHQSVMNTQDQINNQVTQTSIDFNTGIAKQIENHINVDKVRMDEQDQTSVLSSNTHNESIEVDVRITDVQKQIAEETALSNEIQAAIALDVDAKRQQAENVISTIDASKYNEVVTSKQKVDDVYAKVGENAYNNQVTLAENNSKFQTIDNSISNKNTSDAINNHKDAINVKEGVAQVVESSAKNTVKQQNQTVESNEIIREKAEDLVQKEKVKVLENSLKNNETKTLVTEAEKKNIANSDKALTQHKDKVNTVKVVEHTTTVAQHQKSASDDQERLNTQRDIEIRKEEKIQREAVETQRAIEKAENMKDLEKGINTTNASQQAEKTQSSYDAKKEIDKVEVKAVTPAHVKNTLGEKYPEGVSQEVFQRKDEAGILSAIVTRRVVVIEGRGNEYVKTQTNSATTYSKNGKPVTEFVWQKETQDAKLQRHY